MIALEGTEYGFLGVVLAALGLATWRTLAALANWIKPKADALLLAFAESLRVQTETNETNSAALVRIAESLNLHGESLEECRKAVVTLANAAGDRATMEALQRIETLLERHATADEQREAALAQIRSELERVRVFLPPAARPPTPN